jgi:hypothetical protein
MFFSIGRSPKINFPNQNQIGDIFINLDEGWRYTKIESKRVFFKGYLDFGLLEESINQIILDETPKLSGNFCVIIIDQNIEIKGSKYRSFPIYYNDQEVTNLVQLDKNIGANCIAKFDFDLKPTIETFNILGSITTDTLSFEQSVNLIDSLLSNKIESFLKYNQLPVKIFLTGGLDSMLIYSYIKKYTSNFELLNYQHFEYDYFWMQNYTDIKKFWAYNQLHHWREPCMLAVGTPGDEFMMRGPLVGNAYLRHFNSGIMESLKMDKFKNCIHFDYFQKESNKKIYAEQQKQSATFKNLQLLTHYICHNVYNDFQHWHLGETLTYSPLRDLDITKIILRTDMESVQNQIMDGAISKALMAGNDPNLLEYISPQKNSAGSFKIVSPLILQI